MKNIFFERLFFSLFEDLKQGHFHFFFGVVHQDRGQRNGREPRSWSAVTSEPVQKSFRKPKQQSGQAQERYDQSNGPSNEFQPSVDRNNDAKDHVSSALE